jgi:endonuclease-3
MNSCTGLRMWRSEGRRVLNYLLSIEIFNAGGWVTRRFTINSSSGTRKGPEVKSCTVHIACQSEVVLLAMVERCSVSLPNKTGSIWRRPQSVRNREVRSVCKILTENYGTPRFGNPADPLDDLIYITLSNKTTPGMARKTYKRLRKRFHSWEEVLVAPIAVLRSVLRPAGLSAIKSRYIRAALHSIREHFKTFDLKPLKLLCPEAAQDYLVALPGVSEKVAKCVMMYTLGMEVLPVDSHVHRISSRLGWTSRRRADQCHGELEALVPSALRRSFHVACIAHGRKACRPRNPLCEGCCVNRYCEFFRAAQ